MREQRWGQAKPSVTIQSNTLLQVSFGGKKKLVFKPIGLYTTTKSEVRKFQEDPCLNPTSIQLCNLSQAFISVRTPGENWVYLRGL